MNIDQLRYFADLAKTKSMNTTAKRMFISQPALSESVKRLEEELNCVLLIRSKTGIAFTEDGKMVLEHALRILEHHDQIRRNLQIKYDQEHLHGKLVIGVGPTINDTFLPDLLLEMHQCHPHITLSVLENSSDSLFSLLENSIIDIGLIGFSKTFPQGFSLSCVYDNYYIKKLFSDPIVCVMEKSHPLSMYKTLTREQLKNQKQTVYGNDASFITTVGALHISTNAKVHQQFMKNVGTICTMPYHAFLALYPQNEFVCKAVTDAEPVVTYLICNQSSLEKSPELFQAFIDISSIVTPK